MIDLSASLPDAAACPDASDASSELDPVSAAMERMVRQPHSPTNAVAGCAAHDGYDDVGASMLAHAGIDDADDEPIVFPVLPASSFEQRVRYVAKDSEAALSSTPPQQDCITQGREETQFYDTWLGDLASHGVPPLYIRSCENMNDDLNENIANGRTRRAQERDAAAAALAPPAAAPLPAQRSDELRIVLSDFAAPTAVQSGPIMRESTRLRLACDRYDTLRAQQHDTLREAVIDGRRWARAHSLTASSSRAVCDAPCSLIRLHARQEPGVARVSLVARELGVPQRTLHVILFVLWLVGVVVPDRKPGTGYYHWAGLQDLGSAVTAIVRGPHTLSVSLNGHGRSLLWLVEDFLRAFVESGERIVTHATMVSASSRRLDGCEPTPPSVCHVAGVFTSIGLIAPIRITATDERAYLWDAPLHSPYTVPTTIDYTRDSVLRRADAIAHLSAPARSTASALVAAAARPASDTRNDREEKSLRAPCDELVATRAPDAIPSSPLELGVPVRSLVPTTTAQHTAFEAMLVAMSQKARSRVADHRALLDPLQPVAATVHRQRALHDALQRDAATEHAAGGIASRPTVQRLTFDTHLTTILVSRYLTADDAAAETTLRRARRLHGIDGVSDVTSVLASQLPRRSSLKRARSPAWSVAEPHLSASSHMSARSDVSASSGRCCSGRRSLGTRRHCSSRIDQCAHRSLRTRATIERQCSEQCSDDQKRMSMISPLLPPDFWSHPDFEPPHLTLAAC